MDDLTKRITDLESQVDELADELFAHQLVLAWLLKTHPHPEATRLLSRLANELEERQGNESVVRALDELRERYAQLDAYRSGHQDIQ
jgi:hypothetical protein